MLPVTSEPMRTRRNRLSEHNGKIRVISKTKMEGGAGPRPKLRQVARRKADAATGRNLRFRSGGIRSSEASHPKTWQKEESGRSCPERSE
jgi:hypothetical protein